MTADDLAKILDELGRRLGPAGEHVFQLAIRQVYIEAIVSVILLAIVVAVGVAVGPRLYRWQLDNPNYGSRDIAAALIGAFYAMAACVVIVAAVISLTALLNPEYAAIRDLIKAVR